MSHEVKLTYTLYTHDKHTSGTYKSACAYVRVCERHCMRAVDFGCLCVGAASRSFTSTAVNVVTRNERQKVRVERNPTKKGYMRLHTNLGDLNLELHCDLAPRTCENFFVLSEGGYYTDTVFHRSIKSFMIQVCLHYFIFHIFHGRLVSQSVILYWQ